MPAASLTSVRSDRVTSVRRLHDRSGRRKSGRFVVEGPQAVSAALASDVQVCDLFVDVEAAPAIQALADGSSCGITWATPSVLSAMGETSTPQGILAVCRIPADPSLDDLLSRPGPVVLLDGVSDPGNVGTIIRTADAAGCAGIIAGTGCADVYSGKVVRSTAGSLFHLPVIASLPLRDVVVAARASGRPVLALVGEGDADLFTLPPATCQDACWIVGSEAHGVDPGLQSASDARVRIPMAGGAESLNAAVAGALALYVGNAIAGGQLQGSGTFGAAHRRPSHEG